jgi:hypothetical protein
MTCCHNSEDHNHQQHENVKFEFLNNLLKLLKCPVKKENKRELKVVIYLASSVGTLEVYPVVSVVPYTLQSQKVGII